MDHENHGHHSNTSEPIPRSSPDPLLVAKFLLPVFVKINLYRYRFFSTAAMTMAASHDSETPAPTTSIPRRVFVGLLLGSLVLGAFTFLRPFRLTFGGQLLDALSILYALFLALVCFRGSWGLLSMVGPPGTGTQTGRRFIPFLLGMSTLWAALALLGWVSETMWTQRASTYPTLFHVLELGVYPFFIAAVLLLPSPNLSRLSRLRILLDSLIILATVVTLYVYVFAVPMLVTTRLTLLEKTLGSLFVTANLVSLFCLLFVAFQTVHVGIRKVIALLTLAMVIFLVGHVVYYTLLHSAEASLTTGPDPGLLGSLTLIAVAAQTMRRVLVQGTPAERGPTVLLEETWAFAHWKIWLVSILVLIFALLLVSLAIQPANVYTPARLQVVEFGGTGILILLVLRQLLVTHELYILKQDLRETNAQLDRLAASDPLTGVPNYRTLVNTLGEELERAKAQQTTCSILFMDIDQFKAVNDQYGHAVGDLVLCQVAGLAASLLRSEDCLGRWGGEEFVAILPGQGPTEAFTVAERIRMRVSEQVFAGQKDLHVSCSLGVATYPQMATEREWLLICADQAMYEAKRLGRNQSCLAKLEKGII
ncbi:hypothetical protein KSD_89120 [Ktedonobacter sp. SOSP1-85]|uniref:GGDEF domain-containing protein n=1 Tax=Ktedonobacter sp. SOSP1-85 TaxID=2778367 RepID=UPI0019164A36|nr:diguanylate cyclase [Ktedonobacter sp. SOSP1-85]GHO81141.1 hypothetical protein KSD_89120 [Ktedonobacter sp. SOSP1-85]